MIGLDVINLLRDTRGTHSLKRISARRRTEIRLLNYSSVSVSSSELIADRQLPDPLAGRREYRIA